MKELSDGGYVVRNHDEYEEAIKDFLKTRMIEAWWREKIIDKPNVFPSVVHFGVIMPTFDMYSRIQSLKKYKADAEKVWREIEAL